MIGIFCATVGPVALYAAYGHAQRHRVARHAERAARTPRGHTSPPDTTALKAALNHRQETTR
ncbi:hypothetical protein [Streptomyces sp. NPDC059076]|uniref:hypothetical protein n=1 Tax=unclassified Streptomyces TaxID=2593676 RepID=UPI0036787DCC